jgi:hypothetical protein
MKKQTAVQVFSLLAVVIALGVSYSPPTNNAPAIWAILTMFMGYAIRDLFGVDGAGADSQDVAVAAVAVAAVAVAPAAPVAPSAQGIALSIPA